MIMSSEEEAGIRKSKKQSAAFCGDKSPIPMLNVTGSKHIVSNVNDAFCDLVANKREDLVGLPFADVGSITENCISHLDRIYSSGKAETYYEERDTKSNLSSRLYTMWPMASEKHPSGIMIQIMAAEKSANEFREMNEALMLSAVQQHKQIESDTAQLAKINESLLAEIEERKRTEKRLRLSQKNLSLVEERSRQKFAAELHDTVIQTLGAAKLRSEFLREFVTEKGVKHFTEMQTFISQSIQESRQIMAELSPPVLKQFGFIAALEWLSEQVGSQARLEIKFRCKSEIGEIDHELQVLLFQATRELLMNIIKHSQAKKAGIIITQKNEKIRISVKDNGIGFHGNVSFREDLGGFGLFTIRERLTHLGGQLLIESKKNLGTCVTIVSPMQIKIDP